MQSQEFFQAATRRCRCLTGEPQLSDLLRDPMTVALMAADRVDRRDLDALFARTRSTLRRMSA
jgi:hypothetical protein